MSRVTERRGCTDGFTMRKGNDCDLDFHDRRGRGKDSKATSGKDECCIILMKTWDRERAEEGEKK